MKLSDVTKIFEESHMSVLCLDGNVSVEFDENIPVIAADGAFNKLRNLGIIPMAVVGDFDSVDISTVNPDLTELVIVDDQDTCDFEKSISYIKRKNLFPSIIIGMSGGVVDHVINNISVFGSLQKCIFINSETIGFVLNSRELISLSLPIFTKLSIFGAPAAYVSTIGLKWELAKSRLEFFKNNSCFNRTLTENISIHVHNGNAIVVFHYG